MRTSRHGSGQAALSISSPLVLLMVLSPVFTSAAQLRQTVCAIPTYPSEDLSTWSLFSVRYFAPQFPLIDWRTHMLSNYEITAKSVVGAWVKEGSSCDLLIGVGWSFLSAAMGPLVSIPWIDPGATSTELSDKQNYPTFSRTIPTDEFGARGAAAVYEAFGWESTDIFCSDEPYGRSVASGLSSAMTDLGYTVDTVRCIEQSATEDRVRVTLDSFVHSGTKAVLVAAFNGSDLFTNFLTVVQRGRYFEKLVFFFSDGLCYGPSIWTVVPGALCYSYLADAVKAAPIVAAYNARNVTPERQFFNTLGYGPIDPYVYNFYDALAVDAVYHLMYSVNQYYATNQSGDINSYIRAQTTVGLTGIIQLNSNGDRLGVNTLIDNSQFNGTSVSIGNVTNYTFRFLSDSATGEPPSMVFFNQLWRTVPSVLNAKTSVGSRVALIVGLVAGVLLVALLALLAASKLLAPKTRDVSAAPKDGAKPFAIAFTDIQSSTALWARVPAAMSTAVDLHHAAVRKVLARHRGYEVKTIGDSFMCAFLDADSAVAFAVDAQYELHRMAWPPEIDAAYQELMAEAGLPPVLNYAECWNGLRVRVGVNFGQGSVQFDEVTLGYDYYGTVVNTAARVEAVAHGGQILATEECLSAVKHLPEGVAVRSLGPQPLRGLDCPIALSQIDLPAALGLRKFPPLRLDVEAAVEASGDDQVSQSGGSIARSHASGSRRDGGITDRLEQRALREVKVTSGSLSGVAQVDRMLNYHLFVKTLFSTWSEDFRKKAIAQLAERWRVSAGSRKAGSEAQDMILMEVVLKALKIVDLKPVRPKANALPDVLSSSESTKRIRNQATAPLAEVSRDASLILGDPHHVPSSSSYIRPEGSVDATRERAWEAY